MVDMPYEDFIRTRITELRIAKDVSEHRMSVDLGNSGAYIRGVTSGAAFPSLRELFNIMSYFDMTPSEFFAPLENDDTPYRKLCEQLRILSDEDLEKISTFVNWITE